MLGLRKMYLSPRVVCQKFQLFKPCHWQGPFGVQELVRAELVRIDFCKDRSSHVLSLDFVQQKCENPTAIRIKPHGYFEHCLSPIRKTN